MITRSVAETIRAWQTEKSTKTINCIFFKRLKHLKKNAAVSQKITESLNEGC